MIFLRQNFICIGKVFSHQNLTLGHSSAFKKHSDYENIERSF